MHFYIIQVEQLQKRKLHQLPPKQCKQFCSELNIYTTIFYRESATTTIITPTPLLNQGILA